VVYSDKHHAGQLGETGPPRPDVNLSRTPEEGARSPSGPNGLTIIVIIPRGRLLRFTVFSIPFRTKRYRSRSTTTTSNSKSRAERMM
jgi:hypothetical protein